MQSRNRHERRVFDRGLRRTVNRRALLGGMAATAAFIPRLARAAFNPYLQQHALYLNDGTLFTDGASHPASGLYANLAATRSVYPFATAQTNELNWLITQKAIYDAGAVGAKIYVGYTGGSTIRMTNANSALDGSGTLRFADWLDFFNAGASGIIEFEGEGEGTVFSWPDDLGKPTDVTVAMSFSGQLMTVTGTPASPIIPGMFVYTTFTFIGDTGNDGQPRIVNQVSGTNGWPATGSPGGAGVYQLTHSVTASPGSYLLTFRGACEFWGRRLAVVCGAYSSTFNGAQGLKIRNVRFSGPGAGTTLGASSCNMMGFGTCDKVDLEDVTCGDLGDAIRASTGFWAGLNVQGGQCNWKRVKTGNNYYGRYWNNQTTQFGNISRDHCESNTNRRAGDGVSVVNAMQSCVSTEEVSDTQPYAIFKESITSAAISALGYDPTTLGVYPLITLDCKYDGFQCENIGNAAIGDGLGPATLTGSISGTTLTVTAGTAQVGHHLQQISGGPAIAAGTYIVAFISGNTWTVNVSQTVASGQISAVKVSEIRTTTFDPMQAMWYFTGGAAQANVQIAAEPAASLIDVSRISGLIRPMVSFGWTPGTNSVFGNPGAAAIGSVTPQPGLKIVGDLGVILQNCTTGSFVGGHQFFSTNSFITPGMVEIEEPGFWKATVAPTFDSGYGTTPLAPLGAVVLRGVSTPGTIRVSTGAVATDDVMGVVILSNLWPLIAVAGEVPVASGGASLFAENLVQSAASGQIALVSGSPTGTVIGRAIASSSGGFTQVRLQGLE